MNSVEKYVFSRTLNSVDWENTKLVKDDAVSQVKELKKRQGSDIFVFGSADFSSTLMKHELVDEYHFGVNVVVGQGIPWFKGGHNTMGMELIRSNTLKSGVVLLFYRPL